MTLYHNLHYNNRQQLVDIRVGGSSTDEWNWSRGALISYYGTAARDAWDPFKNSPDNNGNVLRQLHYVPLSGGGYVLPQLDDYTYDELNRIKSVTEAQLNSSGGWTFNLFTQNFGYDRWGNRSVSCSPCQPGVTGDVFTIDAATNRITAKNGNGMTYDSAGNQTYDATGNRWFDGENRMYKAVQSGTTSYYVYDADGKRVRRIIGSTETWMIYGIDGELVGEYAAAASATSPQKEYGYRSGQMLIVAQTSPLEIRWTVPDHLGTPRMNIMGNGASGGLLSSVTRHDYLPFGEEQIAGIRVNGGNGQHGYEPPPDGVRQKFTGHERDSETGLDFAQARYYANVQGRFTSPDNPLADQDSKDPQSWILYAYVRNRPLAHVDRNGRACSKLLGNTGSGYCKRAEEYGHYDANPEINKRTRFFAAAAAASQALASGDTAEGFERAFLSTTTRAFLSVVGEELLKVNRDVIRTIQDGGSLTFPGPDPTGPALDAKLVRLEQSTVQNLLDNLKNANPDKYNTVIMENNALLNPSGFIMEAAMSSRISFATDKAFGKVLEAVRKDLGRNIDFARQSDREAIGLKLVEHIRKTGGCDVGGDKIGGCK
ncbi:MAG: RHS repeat domain-containing protein [Blastocatellales bacterium]